MTIQTKDFDTGTATLPRVDANTTAFDTALAILKREGRARDRERPRCRRACGAEA